MRTYSGRPLCLVDSVCLCSFFGPTMVSSMKQTGTSQQGTSSAGWLLLPILAILWTAGKFHADSKMPTVDTLRFLGRLEFAAMFARTFEFALAVLRSRVGCR